jgi:serine/threonine protein kinase
MSFSDEDRKALTCDPSDYTYKYTVSATESSWVMVYHFEDIKLDVEICVYHLDHERASKIFEHIRHLLSLRSEYIHSPEKVFNWCGELWLIFPFTIGRTLNEVLNRSHSNGLPNERLTARILLDVLEALEILHKANICHRNIATYNLFLEKATGLTKLKDFTNLKFVEGDDINLHKTIWKSKKYSWLKPPEMLGFYASCEREQDVDERKADIFLFAITALNLAYGSVPRNPYPNMSVLEPTNWIAPSETDYQTQPEHISDAFKAMLAPCLSKSTKARPSAKELKKSKFFNCAASRSEVKKLLCSFFKTVDPPQINDLPPSQLPDINTPATEGSAWDFGSITREASGKKDFESITEVRTEPAEEPRLEIRRKKSETPIIGIVDDQSKVLGSQVLDAVNQTVLLSSEVSPTKSPGNSTRAVEQYTEGDASNPHQKAKTRFHVVKYDNLSSDSKIQAVLNEQGIPATGDQQTPHDPDARIIKRFHVKEDGNEATCHSDEASGTSASASTAVVPPLTSQLSSSSKKLASRFKVEDVQHVGISANQATQPIWQQKKPTEWVIEDVCMWLQSLGGDFKVYVNNFREAGIDGDMLHALTDDELDELQVTKKIHKRRILTSISKLQWS